MEINQSLPDVRGNFDFYTLRFSKKRVNIVLSFIKYLCVSSVAYFAGLLTYKFIN